MIQAVSYPFVKRDRQRDRAMSSKSNAFVADGNRGHKVE